MMSYIQIYAISYWSDVTTLSQSYSRNVVSKLNYIDSSYVTSEKQFSSGFKLLFKTLMLPGFFLVHSFSKIHDLYVKRKYIA